MARAAGFAGVAAGRPSAGSRCLLYGALLLFGLAGALGARAAELPRMSADPRPVVPTAPGAAAALIAPPAIISPRAGLVDEASVCQALAEAFSGTTAVIVGATGLPADTFRGFAGDLPTAAEPPPLVAATQAGGPVVSGASGASGASGVLAAAEAALDPQPAAAAIISPATASPPPPAPSSIPAAAVAERAAAPNPTMPAAAAPAAAPKPVPEPHPALGFDAAFGVPRRPFGKLIYQIARSYALNPLLVAAIAKVESDFNPRARSRKGACGLMQVLPSTARRFGLPRKRDLFNPRKNIETASRYLRWLVDRFGDDPVRVLAAYNAGEGAVDRFGG
ncbi:MAG: lytic transglycosylase domain-containing protein, partial [Acidobacteria bacterium]|nr:lytic transglycosylase domain-containing protein [Acidobacteriota bacterium]